MRSSHRNNALLLLFGSPGRSKTGAIAGAKDRCLGLYMGGKGEKRSMQHMEPWGGDGRSGEIKGAHSLRLLMQTVGGGYAGRCWKVGLGAMFK